jgi:hypothetical protein
MKEKGKGMGAGEGQWGGYLCLWIQETDKAYGKMVISKGKMGKSV